MATIINTKLGVNRGKPRVWIEGDKLAREGIKIGSTYNVEINKDGCVLSVCDGGVFKVSRRKARTERSVDKPLIEVKDLRLEEIFAETPELRVCVTKNKITIKARAMYEKRSIRVSEIKRKIANGLPLKTVSVFHGGGVMDRALHDGLAKSSVLSKVGLCVERESAYIDSSIRNNAELFDADSIIMQSSLEDLDLHSSCGQYDALFAGINCTDHSVAGKAKKAAKLGGVAERGDSGTQIFYLLNLIAKVNAPMIVLECVTQFANSVSATLLRGVLGDLGYCVQEREFAGNDSGALENRKRWVMVALDQSLFELMRFDLDDVKASKMKPECVGDILDEVALDDPSWKSYEYLKEKELRDIAAGKGFRRQLVDNLSDKIPCITREYQKVRSTDPMVQHPKNKDLTRLLSVEEHARAKTAPIQIVAGNSKAIAHQILGQSVIFNTFFDIGSNIGFELNKAFCNDLAKVA
ncbi:MAG: DNA cytosine methyltransferase [Pseudoalteromonas sp.]|uniref:DNA cytosine methyltransferase n=1 Tax=Pseudoalteromonas sp. TaxID=53249 RepID=UPI0025ECFA25|nr:DNA cytosine methyltransferase [Pseudoalteromonas sp.]MCH2089508.1 DNA cytosine methyltransferase [Pseudoalteromonas sp.]